MRSVGSGRRTSGGPAALLAAAALSLAAPPAWSGSAPAPVEVIPGADSGALLHMLQDYCVAGQARAPYAMEAARRDGFALAPQAMVQPMVDAAGIRNAAVRAKFIDRAMIIVAAGNMVERGQAFDFCAIGVVPAPAGRIVDEIRAWVGVDPAAAEEPGTTTFSYVEMPNGQRRSSEELTVAELRRAGSEGRVHVVAVMESAEITMVMYGALQARTS